MKKILTFFAITTFFSCESQDRNGISSYNYNTIVSFSVFNAKGEDLLDSNSPNHLDVSKIKLFYVVDGVSKEFFNANLDNARNFKIFKHEKEYRINVVMNDEDKSEKTITYIQWNEKNTDTIETTFFRSKTSIYPKDVWLNGKLVSGGTKPGDSPYVKLTK
jgi:hypothetical protein